MGCYKGKDISIGLQVFRDSYRATEDFFKSSVRAVEEMKSKGIDINKADFDFYVRENFIDTITEEADYFRFRKKETAKLLERALKELGIGGRYAIGRPGEFKVGKISIPAQEKMQRIKDAYLAGDPHIEGLSRGESIIVQNLIDGKNLQNDSVLKDVISSLKEIREKGKSDLEGLVEARDKAIAERNKLVKSDISKLTTEQQTLRKIAGKAYEGGVVDINELVDLAKDAGVKINPANFDDDTKKIAERILIRLDQKAGLSRAQRLLYGPTKLFGEFMVWGFHDTQSAINILSKRGSKSTTGGITKTLIYDVLKDAEGDMIGDREANMVLMGELVAKAYGEKIPTFTGKKAAKKKAEYFEQMLKTHAVRSGIQYKTLYRDNNNRPITMSKGQLMQLYIDSINPSSRASLTAAGMTQERLNTLMKDPNNGLTDQDKMFALSMVTEFYPSLYAKENPVYKKIHHTSLPNLSNYAGPMSYAEDSDEHNDSYNVSPDSFQTRQAQSVILVNAKSRTGEGKPANLERNIFAIAVRRANNSAKFVNGAEAHALVSSALDAIKPEADEAHYVNYVGLLRRRADGLFGLNNSKTPFPKLINTFKGNFTGAVLSLKPKLALNQVTSNTTWLIEDSFWSGLKNKPTELNGINISKYLFDNDPVLRDRYKGKNIIALDAQIEGAAFQTQQLLKSKSYLQKSVDWVSSVGTTLLSTGDELGILSLGRYFFIGEYKRYRGDGFDHDSAAKAAVKAFTRKFTTTQQSFSQLDRSDLQNNPYGSTFTMFQTTPFQYGRQVVDSVDQIQRAVRGKEYKGNPLYNMGRVAIFHFLAGGMYWFVTKGAVALIYGEWDDDEWEELWKAMYRGPWFTSIFIFGDIIEDTYNWIDGATWETPIAKSQAFGTLDKIQYTWKKMLTIVLKDNKKNSDYEKLEELRFELFSLFGKLGGVAIDRMAINIETVGNLLKGEATLDDAMKSFGYSQYTIDEAKSNGGKDKKKKKKPKKVIKGTDFKSQKSNDRFKSGGKDFKKQKDKKRFN